MGWTPLYAYDHDKLLRTIVSVHANENVEVRDGETRKKKPNDCIDDGTRDGIPICASNGKLYLNMNRFRYNKCLIKAEMNEDIFLADPSFCKDARFEDIKSEGLIPQAG
ncbi:Protease inhibitor protein [Plasmopara halstedii]|uniref:Protease inhibitor protein n=1 Tax=Plasmopara halstedii TaxID=4781 RepID=A0A0P1A641_PLAHL|nr:Protease inhibitor protein [Plasmopara halstedii]CEG36012.1 Protease inhibitor protein [Plasmopara halstedii]|eukprot:XP_024572381.1 Protease inhibitor protein [Plasmopara halstedii]